VGVDSLFDVPGRDQKATHSQGVVDARVEAEVPPLVTLTEVAGPQPLAVERRVGRRRLPEISLEDVVPAELEFTAFTRG